MTHDSTLPKKEPSSGKITLAAKKLKEMPFPRHYKKLLMRGKKNTTIRILNERNKYKKGKIYQATDYKGNHFPILITVTEIMYMKFKDIKKYIPDAELKAKEFKKLKPNSKVEIIKFKCRQK